MYFACNIFQTTLIQHFSGTEYKEIDRRTYKQNYYKKYKCHNLKGSSNCIANCITRFTLYVHPISYLKDNTILICVRHLWCTDLPERIG